MFDILQYLEDKDIPYSTSGKNVSSGWVNISCVFCGETSNHLGISLESQGFNCWVCGEKGNIFTLVMYIEGVSYSETKSIISNYEKEEEISKAKDSLVSSKIICIKGLETAFPKEHKNYLIQRGFNPEYIISKYHLKACLHLGGEFAYRIVIPIIMNDQIVSYTARDITGKQKSKYYNLPNRESVTPIKDCLYNIDSIKDKVLIMEGVTDVWRIGDGSVALFGVEYTHQQLRLLFDKNPKEAYVMFDTDAIKKTDKLANILSTFVDKVEVIELDEGDPGDLSEENIIDLRTKISL